MKYGKFQEGTFTHEESRAIHGSFTSINIAEINAALGKEIREDHIAHNMLDSFLEF